MTSTTPLGHNRCAQCGRLSRLYDTWPTCRECCDEVCSDCDVPECRSEDEAHATVCRVCIDPANTDRVVGGQ